MARWKSRFNLFLVVLILLAPAGSKAKCPNANGHFLGFSLDDASLHAKTVKVYSQAQCFDKCLRHLGCAYYNFDQTSSDELHTCELYSDGVKFNVFADENQVIPKMDYTFSWMATDKFSGVSKKS